MSTSDFTAPRVEHPNADVIAGLRECADWLEQHPELVRAEYAAVSFGYSIDTPDARERLTRIADALGDRAVERSAYGGGILIEGKFSGGAKVSISADKRALLAVPMPILEPEPILGRGEKAA